MATLALADGRIMAYHVHGAETGKPVLFVHGGTDSGLLRHHDDALTSSMGVRLISPDLPSIGDSSSDPHGGCAGWASDAMALMDSLGIDKFSIAAHSGGSNYALALAHALPHRVTRVVLAAPIVGLDAPDAPRFIISEELTPFSGFTAGVFIRSFVSHLLIMHAACPSRPN